MTQADYIVLGIYFFVLVAIGLYCARLNKKQEDYFMGGRGFGKLMQTFAAFGAGTGPQDPIITGSGTFTKGMNGMWGVMYWLFVTPFYWITGVWYRRMRHLTLGDWYVERYESKKLGGAYAIFGVVFFMIYGSMFFSAIAKTASPMIGDHITLFGNEIELQYVLVPAVGVIVLLYGMLGGLTAAYFTDLIQGICVIALSCMLIPLGLNALSGSTDLNPEGKGSFDVMHEQLPESFFDLMGGVGADFSLAYLVAIVFSNLFGIVVQPHFIATGGGSAKTENDARIGLVVGNFLKRFCTLGWVLTGLIAATLYADVPALIKDPDQTWGYASMELLGPGLRGLMLACLLAALMSSVDAYMIVGSGLVVRNLYVPFLNPNASEKNCLLMGKITGTIIVTGSIMFSLLIFDMIQQLTITFWFTLVFAAPFWIGMYWRRATTKAAWITVAYCLLFFTIIPYFGPMLAPVWRSNESFLQTDPMTHTVSKEVLNKSSIRKHLALQLETWQTKTDILSGKDRADIKKAAHERLRPRFENKARTKILVPNKQGTELVSLEVGKDKIEVTMPRKFETNKDGTPKLYTDAQAIFWDKVVPVDSSVKPVVTDTVNEGDKTITTYGYPAGTEMRGEGNFKLNLAFFLPFGIDIANQSKANRNALELVPKIIMPFLVMIIASFITSATGAGNSKQALDRYYAKMKTKVLPDPEADQAKLEAVYAGKQEPDRIKLFPNSQLEFQKPTSADIIGFTVSVLTCFAIIGLAFMIAGLGG
ncbi:MAG: hypothetical protein CMJ76_15055 [Planctomycetaceae bacterium]|nr:hypothetical protein [Planctomycetaceae bacterium]